MDGGYGGSGDKKPSGNSGGSGSSGSNFAVNARLLSIVERIERKEEDKKECAEDIKQIYAEAQGEGWDTEALRRLVSRRKKTMEKRREMRGMDDLFDAAVGQSVAPMSPQATEKLDPDYKPPEAKPEAKSKADKKPPGGGSGDNASGNDAPGDGATNQPDMIDELTETPGPAEPTYEEKAFDARMQGMAAAKAGKKITDCPLPYNDPHRTNWEEGWMAEMGSEDGMDVPKALRRKEEKKDDPEAKPARKASKKNEGGFEDSSVDYPKGGSIDDDEPPFDIPDDDPFEGEEGRP